jgi:tRNA threonylcarbamoyl adenosine modification protein (Sua5/YciO/YrdC/YwlC family)
VPRRLLHQKRKTIGLRVPENPTAQALLAELNEPLMSVTLIMPGDADPLIDPYDIRTVLEHDVDLVIDGGYCGLEMTTVVDLADDEPVLVRQGKGDVAPFGL